MEISWKLLAPGHLLNNYLLAHITHLTLALGLAGAASLNHAQGYAARPSFRNPFFGSGSPSQFWGRHWNMVAHGMLKRGVYKPIVNRCRHYPIIAVVATFVASGLLHDYGWRVMGLMTLTENTENNSVVVVHLKQSVFFSYCGIIMLLLDKPFLALKNYVPLPILSTLVVLTVLPVSHWFTGDMVMGRYYDHYSLGLMLIEPI